MWACGFEPAKALIRGLTATPTAAFQVCLGNYQPHRGSRAVLSQMRARHLCEQQRWQPRPRVGEGRRGVGRFLSRPKSAAQQHSHRPTRHQGPFRAPHCTSLFPCGSLCIPINPHSASPPPCTRHSMSDTEFRYITNTESDMNVSPSLQGSTGQLVHSGRWTTRSHTPGGHLVLHQDVQMAGH